MVFHPIPLHDGLSFCVILQAMDPEVLKEMEMALKKSKTLEKLTITGEDEFFDLPKEFICHILLGTRQNTSLSDLHLNFAPFAPFTWDCPNDGRLAYVSHILCDSVGCIVYSV